MHLYFSIDSPFLKMAYELTIDVLNLSTAGQRLNSLLKLLFWVELRIQFFLISEHN